MTAEPTNVLVDLQRHDHVAIITMRRPEKRNAMNRGLAEALDAALNELDDDTDLWAGVLTGGSDHFSAGSDLTALGDYSTERGGEYGIIRRRRIKPLIAAVEGFALGGGMEIALACDLVVAGRGARFGLPEVGIGVLPTCGGLFRAPQSLPINLAREMILTGQPISAERAYVAGFVNLLTDDGGAVDGALGLARQISDNAPLSVQACLVAIDAQLHAASEPGWQLTDQAMAVIAGTADSAEGVKSFLEKRRPRWRAK